MAKNLKRSVSVLLAVLMIVTMIATFPLNAAAAKPTDEGKGWVFSTDSTPVYSLSGKYYNDNGTPTAFPASGSFSVDTVNKTISLGGCVVAAYEDSAAFIDFAQSVYVTGTGDLGDPFVFKPNYIYGDKSSEATITNSLATVAVGSENKDISSQTVMNPGDGLKKFAKASISGGSPAVRDYVQFLPYDNIAIPSGAYVVVGNSSNSDTSDTYGANHSGKNVQNSNPNTDHALPKRKFNNGNDTLYYIGNKSYTPAGSNETYDLHQFAETRSFKRSFEGDTGTTYTVMWKNQDGTLLDMGVYNSGETPTYYGEIPTKASNAQYRFEFAGWDKEITAVTEDTTYTADFDAVSLGADGVNVNAWIFSVSDGKSYNEIAGKHYTYSGENHSFSNGGSFSKVGDTIYLSGQPVADIEEGSIGKDGETRTFAGTVYVTVTGNGDDALYTFTPNYIYSAPTQQYIKNGVTVAAGAENYDSKLCDAQANPGDGFSATAKVRTGTSTKVQFLPSTNYYTAMNSGYLGVGATTYGYKQYKTAKASPYTFSGSNDVLYYYGTDVSKEDSEQSVYLFSESSPPLRSSFDETESQVYTVTWVNDDGTSLGKSTYYKYDKPHYNGTPTKTSADYVYTFNNKWIDTATNEEYNGNNLPKVTANVTYAAQYDQTAAKRFAKHSLSLDGDIGVNYYMDVTSSDVTTGEGVVLHFSWDDNNVSYKLESSDLDPVSGYYKAKCCVAAAEMTMNIHTTVSINGETIGETDDYSVKKYADEILKAPANTFADQEKLTDLVMKMLDYGAKAQVVFELNTNNPANKGVDYEMVPITASDITSTASDMKSGIGNYGLEYKGLSMVFLSKSTLRLYYKVTDESTYSGVTVTGDFTKGVNDPWIYYEVANIPAAQYDKVQYLTFNGTTYNYAVTDYIKTLLEKHYSEADDNLAIAAYRYHQAAKTYFPEGGN